MDTHVHDTEVLALCGDDRRLAERQIDVTAAQPADVPDDPDRHVHRVARIILGAHLVALARSTAVGLAPRASTLAAVRPEDHFHLTWPHESSACAPWCRNGTLLRRLDSAEN